MKTKSSVTAKCSITRLIACQFVVLLALSCFALSAIAGQPSRPAPYCPPPAKPKTIWHANGNGRSAEAQFSAEGGGGRINVFQNGNSTFLFYEMWANDLSSEECTAIIDQFGNPIIVCHFTRYISHYGWGQIPNDAVQFAEGSMRLVTTTGTNFFTTTCTTDNSTTNAVTTCIENEIPVSFDLTWEANDFSTQSIVGLNQHSFASFAFTSTGASVARSAYVTGNALGRTLANAPGRLGETRGRNVATVTAP